MSHIRFEVVRVSLLQTEPHWTSAWTPELSIQVHCCPIDSLSKGVFSSILKLTFMVISFVLCSIPMGIFFLRFQLQQMRRIIRWFWFIYLNLLLYSFSTVESNRQRVAHHRTYRVIVWKPFEASDGAWEEPQIFPAPSAAVTQPSNSTRSRCVATKSKRKPAIKVRVVPVRHWRYRSWCRHWRWWRRNGNGRWRRSPDEWIRSVGREQRIRQWNQQEAKATSFVLKGANFRAGAEVPSAEVLVSTRTWTSCITYSTDTNTS